MFHIAGSVPAVRNLWLIGDGFLHSMFMTLQELKVMTTEVENEIMHTPDTTNEELKSSEKPKKESLYIYDYFNVSALTANLLSLIKSPMECIHNALEKGLNDTSKLPHAIVMVINQDLLDSFDNAPSGKSNIIALLWKWLVQNMDRSIMVKKENQYNA